MLALDANLWIAAFDPADAFHDDSVALFRAAAKRGLPLAGPAFVVLESVCALARRIGDSAAARTAGEKMTGHPESVASHRRPVEATVDRSGLLRRRAAAALRVEE